MAPEEVCDILKERFGAAVLDAKLDARRPYVVVDVARWHDIALFLRDDERLQFNMLECLSALDLLEDNKLAAVYDMFSVPVVIASASTVVGGSGCKSTPLLRHHMAVRVEVDRDKPRIPTVSDVWPAADWHEREAFDMMGIVFDNHPDMTRILCPDDWEGYPLRKDYEFPLEYHGIPATTEHTLTNPKH